MVVGEDGALPLPWLESTVAAAVRSERGHALLLRAAPGAGALEAALAIAQSRLCERPQAGGLACGRCGSCRLVQSHGHPDLFVLLPEVVRRACNWLLPDDRWENDDAKRKPSRQIRIDDVRALLAWVTQTSSRGHGKMIVLHPVEALNDHAASALLKTVEEPPALTRMVLTCSDTYHVLPTVRSRCQQIDMPVPDAAAALRWLGLQGVVQPQVLLTACAGLPLDALQWHAQGVNAAAWQILPLGLAQGRAGALAGWNVPQALQALLRLCHDAMTVAAGGAPRFFARAELPERPDLGALTRWSHELVRLAQAADHPWHEALAIEALASGARLALNPPSGGPQSRAAARRLDTLPS